MQRRIFVLVSASAALALACGGATTQGAREPRPRPPRSPPSCSVVSATTTAPITTTSPEAQRYFDQGLALIYGFNHDAAIRAFDQALALDPALRDVRVGQGHRARPEHQPAARPDAAPRTPTPRPAGAGARAERLRRRAGADRGDRGALHADLLGRPRRARPRLRERDARGAQAPSRGRGRRGAHGRGADEPLPVELLDAGREAEGAHRSSWWRSSSGRWSRSPRTSARTTTTSTPIEEHFPEKAEPVADRLAHARARRGPPRAHAGPHLLPRRPLPGRRGRERERDRERRGLLRALPAGRLLPRGLLPAQHPLPVGRRGDRGPERRGALDRA